ncbi:MAG TPA: hypothetical protein V6D03_05580, partial [Candidatus Caenarcaniphilales bacterium]
KRQGQNIYELFGRTCPTCGGLGHLVHLPGQFLETAGESGGRYGASRTQLSANGAESRALELRESQEMRAEEFDLDSLESAQSLDLTNHPSYQGRGEVSSSRRRRRPALGSSLSKVTAHPKPGEEVPYLPAPAPVKDSEVPAPQGATPAPTNSTKLEPLQRRTKPIQREVIKPTEAPPEIISVEMTPEEQEVYALMGISPLVLFDGEVKNLKSTVVAIKSPNDSAADFADCSEPTQSLPDEVTQPHLVETQMPPEPRLVESEVKPAETSTQVLSETNEPGNGVSVTRRRRRRSSAPETQLSLGTES